MPDNSHFSYLNITIKSLDDDSFLHMMNICNHMQQQEQLKQNLEYDAPQQYSLKKIDMANKEKQKKT